MSVDRVLLDQLSSSINGIKRASRICWIRKNGSVEVLRARLIRNQVMGDYDFSWDNTGDVTPRVRNILKIFGIKSSGSHKERRQSLAPPDYDSRRLTVEISLKWNGTSYTPCVKVRIAINRN